MSYLKYGIVTKIQKQDQSKYNETFITNNFNIKLYNQKKDYYLIKNDILNKNLKTFRDEVLSFCDYKADSIENCEAYCLNTTAAKLLCSELVLIDEGDKYYFKRNKDFVFDSECLYYFSNNVNLRFNFISIFWDINSISYEDFTLVGTFLNNILKKALTNCLKDASLLLVT